MSPILFSSFNIHSNPNVSIRYVNSDIGEAHSVVVFLQQIQCTEILSWHFMEIKLYFGFGKYSVASLSESV